MYHPTCHLTRFLIYTNIAIMEFKRKLFLLEPFVNSKVWGVEQWIVSTMKDSSSFFYDNAKPVPVKTLTNSDYPLLIKTIHADETLSVQVHPSDEYAMAHENTHGKSECWYILEAEPEATIISGLNGNFTKEEIRLAIKENRIESYLYETTVSKGDFLFIPAGTVHAIKGGVTILEIQQPSDLTYRLYDWNRNRETHIEKSLDVITNFVSKPVRNFSGAFECDYFKIEKASVNGKAEIKPLIGSCWASYFIIDGNGTFACNGEALDVKKGSTIFAAPDTTITASGSFSVMKIYPKKY